MNLGRGAAQFLQILFNTPRRIFKIDEIGICKNWQKYAIVSDNIWILLNFFHLTP